MDADSEGLEEADRAGSDIGTVGLALYCKLLQRCKKVLGDIRARHRAQIIERQGQRHRPLTLEDVERRLAAAQQPPDIVKLLRGLVASERIVEEDLGKSGGQVVIECSAPDSISVDEDSGPWHGEEGAPSQGAVEAAVASPGQVQESTTSAPGRSTFHASRSPPDGAGAREKLRRQLLEWVPVFSEWTTSDKLTRNTQGACLTPRCAYGGPVVPYLRGG